MRATVVVLDALVYVPALFMFSRTWQASRSKRTQVFRVDFLILHVLRYYRSPQELAFLTLILQPALLLIDFGHFQYNSVMLGKLITTYHDNKGESSCLVCRSYAPFSQFFCYWTRSHGSIFFRSESWFQANDFVLCTCNWLVASCKMLVLRPY